MDVTRQDEKRLKLELRLAQLEKNEACKKKLFNICKNDMAVFYTGKAP